MVKLTNLLAYKSGFMYNISNRVLLEEITQENYYNYILYQFTLEKELLRREEHNHAKHQSVVCACAWHGDGFHRAHLLDLAHKDNERCNLQ